MANPYVNLGNYVYDPETPVIERHYFTMVDFESAQFFIYKEAERDGTDFVPQGDKFIYFENLKDAIINKPDFIDDLTWDISGSGGLSKAPSGFLTGAYSIMPKLIVPTKLIVDNGIANASDVTKTGLMAWTTPLEETKITVGGDVGSKFISFNGKNDNSSNNSSLNVQEAGLGSTLPYNDYVYYLSNLPGDIGFDAGDSFVGSGAFMITINVIPTEKGGQSTADAPESKWKVVMDTTTTGGELIMTLDESGSLIININGQITKAQLSEAKAKDNAPQNSKIKEGHKYDIVVYPVWNGVVVSSGIQDSSSAVKTGSQYCIMNKKAHIMTSPWSDGFDPEAARTSPEDYEIRVSSEDVEMLTNWKPINNIPSKLDVTVTNCRVDAYFIPLFFSQNCKFDIYSLVSKDTTEIIHDYYIHPIYTRNGNTGTRLRYEKDSYTYEYNDDNEFIRFSFEMFLKKNTTTTPEEVGVPGRRGGEIFGYVYHVKETTTYNSVNGNGLFPVNGSFWSGGTSGDENYSGDWQDYIQSVNVSYNMDGASGSISVDKYGCAGQYAKANQIIGSITVNVLGMENSGRIFTGIVEGISETNDSNGAEFNLTLNGLNRKLEDIVLINVPFFDGYTLGDVCDFLCKYGGLDADYTYADRTCKLPSSTDINTPIIDFKTGTPVIQALQNVMEQTHHWFVIQPDGKIYFYELNTNDSLPVTLGTDWSTDYPDYSFIITNNQQPDFEDIRNEIIVMGLKQIGGTNTSLKDFQLFPLITWEKQITNPVYPWSRPIVYPVKGYITQETLETVYNNIKGFTQKYEIQGNLSIPGNANIKVYDTWTMNGKQYVITNVTHNVDLQNKSWTTDLEFATGRGW